MEALYHAGKYTNSFLLRQNTHRAVATGITYAYWYLAKSEKVHTKERGQTFVVLPVFLPLPY
jgi:hypothetical protein